jgi:carbon storage regulator
MLILSRKKGESLVLSFDGGEIEVTVAEVAGDKVRLGVKAPDDVSVLRAELKHTADENKGSAAGSITPERLAGLLNNK